MGVLLLESPGEAGMWFSLGYNVSEFLLWGMLNFIIICNYFPFLRHVWMVHGSSDGKASAYNAGDPGSIPGSGRYPGEGNGNPLQYSCLENPVDQGAW